MGVVMSYLGGAWTYCVSVLTDQRKRLRVFTAMAAVLEILTAILAAVQATKLQSYINFMENDQSLAPDNPAVMAITLLVCNCAAEVVLIMLHMFYGCWFLFFRTCFSRSVPAVTMFGVLVTMTFYTSILSLALAGPLQIYDKVFEQLGNSGDTTSSWGFPRSPTYSKTDYTTYGFTYALFYACGSVQFCQAFAIYLARSILVDMEIVQVNDPRKAEAEAAEATRKANAAAAAAARAAAAAFTAPPPAAEVDPDKGRGMFHRMRGKTSVAPVNAPSAMEMGMGNGGGQVTARNPLPGAASPFDAAVANSISSNPWGPPPINAHPPSEPPANGGVRSQNLYGASGSGW